MTKAAILPSFLAKPAGLRPEYVPTVDLVIYETTTGIHSIFALHNRFQFVSQDG